MTSRGAPSPLELRFSIDDRPGVLRAVDISAALGVPAEQANSGGYRDWPQPTQREMVRILARGTTAGPLLFRRQLPPQMLLIDHLLRTSLFSLQHYVQHRGAIPEALYRISEGFWFSPSELVMTSLLHFDDNAKFLKDLCTIKKGLGIEKKVFLTEQVSAIIQSKNPIKYKDPGSPTISVNIGETCIDKELLYLGASVNLLPYSVYEQLGLGVLKPTNITLSLADRSVKIPKGIVKDVLVKVDKFYYPVDFVVLDTEPIANGPNHVPIILANAIINFKNGVMQLTFGNMTLELNIFHLSNRHKLVENENQVTDEVCSVDKNAEKPNVHKLQELDKGNEAVVWKCYASVTTAEQLVSPKSPSEKKKINKEESSIKAVAQATAGVKELLLLDPP